MVHEQIQRTLETIAQLAEVANETGRNISYVGTLSQRGNPSKTVILAQNPEEENDNFFQGLYIAQGMLNGVGAWGKISREHFFLMTDDLTLGDFAKQAGIDLNNRQIFNGEYDPELSDASPGYSGIWHVGASEAQMEQMTSRQRSLVIPYREGTFTFRRETGLWTPQ